MSNPDIDRPGHRTSGGWSVPQPVTAAKHRQRAEQLVAQLEDALADVEISDANVDLFAMLAVAHSQLAQG